MNNDVLEAGDEQKRTTYILLLYEYCPLIISHHGIPRFPREKKWAAELCLSRWCVK